ncbi:hypothetical protein HYZ97_01555 [Candidatus Pacearchaeota archaeon]|nr:hypothetical protein [Candidatus Pacearchaeota archaeon]
MGQARQLQTLAQLIRRECIKEMIGKPVNQLLSSLAATDILASFISQEFRYDLKNQNNPDNDILLVNPEYSILASIFLSRLGIYRDKSARKEQEEKPFMQSLMPQYIPGLLPAIAVGSAYAQHLHKRSGRTIALINESESILPCVYEAARFTVRKQIANILLILPCTGEKSKELKRYWEVLGWNVLIVNGHENKELVSAYALARKSEKPTLMLAHIQPGKGISFIPSGNLLTESEAIHALRELSEQRAYLPQLQRPKRNTMKEIKESAVSGIKYRLTELVSTAQAAHQFRAHHSSQAVMLDGDLAESSGGIALGLTLQKNKVWVSLTESQLSVALPQLRVAAFLAQAPIIVSAEVSTPAADLALARTLSATIFSPADAYAAVYFIKHAFMQKGLTYLRINNEPAPLIYTETESFIQGEYKVLASSPADKLTILSTGYALHEALKAHTLLKRERIPTALIDLYSIKPLSLSGLAAFIQEHGGKLIILENHIEEGGIGEMLTHELISQGITCVHYAQHLKHTESEKTESTSIVAAAQQMLKPIPISLPEVKEKVKSKKKKRR